MLKFGESDVMAGSETVASSLQAIWIQFQQDCTQIITSQVEKRESQLASGWASLEAEKEIVTRERDQLDQDREHLQREHEQLQKEREELDVERTHQSQSHVEGGGMFLPALHWAKHLLLLMM